MAEAHVKSTPGGGVSISQRIAKQGGDGGVGVDFRLSAWICPGIYPGRGIPKVIGTRLFICLLI